MTDKAGSEPTMGAAIVFKQWRSMTSQKLNQKGGKGMVKKLIAL